jgi:hypothetical protein
VTVTGLAVAFGLGVVWFIGAIPAGVGLGLGPVVAAVAAWAGYTAIAAVMVAAGEPARRWLEKRFRLSPHPDPAKFFWRVWLRGGLPALGLLAPVTCGPYFAALLALALGERPGRVLAWIAAGVVPWCVLFALLTALGVQFVPGR